jgi:hypothetical protein
MHENSCFKFSLNVSSWEKLSIAVTNYSYKFGKVDYTILDFTAYAETEALQLIVVYDS